MEDVITVEGADSELLLFGSSPEDNVVTIDGANGELVQLVPIDQVVTIEGVGHQGPKGDRGDTGAQLFYVSAAPDPGSGSVGDFAIQDTGDVYEKTGATTWMLRFNTTGPKGDQGDQGLQGVQGDKGDQGDQGIQGLQGIQGEKGNKGDKGAEIIYVSTIPETSAGRSGDFAVQDNGDVYEKVDETTWILRFNITGPQGEQGIQGEKGDKGDKGDPGDGSGDMVMSMYDTDQDGKVNAADAADSVPWTGVEGRPAAYPPEAHGHEIADVNGLQTGLNDKASVLHSHEIADVTGLQIALDGKAPVAHQHEIEDVNGLQQALNSFAGEGHHHPVSDVDGLQTALDEKAPLVSPALTGLPTAPTATSTDNSTKIATTAFVQAVVNTLINGAPGALDTLQELAAAMGDDPNFATTVTNTLAQKAELGHTHTFADVPGLQAALDGKQANIGYVPLEKHAPTITGGYLDILPYSGTYDDGSVFRSYYNGNSRVWRVYARESGGTSVPIDIELNGNKVWHAGSFNPANKLDATAQAADSAKLNGLSANAYDTVTALSNAGPASGIISSNAYLWRSNTSGSGVYKMTIADFAAALKVHFETQGFDLTGKIVVGTNNRDGGMYGTYVSSKVQHIWSMGAGYKVAADGSNFGNVYGLAYKHTNNPTGGTMAGGHQAVWAQNGVARCAMGNDLWTSGNVSAYSDIRVKTNIEPIEGALAGVLRLNGYTYDRIDTSAHQLGVIAQEVKEIFPELVTGDEDHWSVAYGNFAGVFIEAFKEEDAKVEALKQELSETKAVVNELLARLDALEAT